MSEKKILKEEELNMVAGGTVEADGTNSQLYINAHVEIYYKWYLHIRSFGGTITEIQKTSNDVWLYHINMEDSEYSGWYTEDAINTLHKSSRYVKLNMSTNPW